MASQPTTTDSSALPINPNPDPSWPKDSSTHPGYQVHGTENTPGKKAYYIHLEAEPGKEGQVERFLKDINEGVNQEPGTGPWFGLRYSKTTFCIFEAFDDAEARLDHNRGPGGLNFSTRSAELREMLAYPAQIYRVDIMHGKFDTLFGKKIQVV